MDIVPWGYNLHNILFFMGAGGVGKKLNVSSAEFAQKVV